MNGIIKYVLIIFLTKLKPLMELKQHFLNILNVIIEKEKCNKFY